MSQTPEPANGDATPRTPRSRWRPGVPQYEGFVDRQVREAIERGEFDNLPGAGKPIPGLGGRHDPDWWIKARMEREGLRPALPTPLALRREREEIQATLSDVRHEDDARAIVEDLNARIAQANASVGSLRIFTRGLPVEATLAEWRQRRGGPARGPATGAPD